jgi:hypothetical protein
MPSEPRLPAPSPDFSHQRAEDFRDEPRTLLSDQNGSTDFLLTNDAAALLSLFPRETEVGDFNYAPFVRAVPASITTVTADLTALDDLRRESRQAELASQPHVEQAHAFKTELDQLREAVARLAGEHRRIEEATRAAEERRVAATNSELATLDDLRARLRQAELAFQQPMEHVHALKTELDQHREVAARLAGEHRRIEEATRAADERRVAAINSELATLADLREQLRQAELAIQQPVERAREFKTELDELHDVSARLAGEVRRIEDAMHAAEQRRVEAVESFTAMEARLGPLVAFQERISTADARLTALNNVADQKVSRVGELISTIDSRLARLDKGNQLIERSQEMAGRLEQIASAATSQLAQALNIKKDFDSDLARFEQTVQTLIESARSQVGKPAVEKARVGSAGWILLSRWRDQMTGAFQTQKALLIRYHREVTGFLSVLVLGSVIGMSVLNDAIRRERVVANVLPILTPSTVISSEMMLRTAVPALPHMTPSRIQAPIQTAAAVTAQPTRVPPAQSPKFIGTLEVQSDPAGAAVFINRERVGETPLQLPRVRAGSHVIWIELAGFQRWTAAARVVADAVTRIDAKLEADPVRGIQ